MIISRLSVLNAYLRFNSASSINLASSVRYLKEAKNLTPAIETKTIAGDQQDLKGKLVEFAWTLQQEGYTKDTARVTNCSLRTLLKNNANLLNPISVKDILAKGTWSPSRKHNLISAYTLFLKFNGLAWTKPKCPVPQAIPFIPSEQEIDALISASRRKLSALLQVLKETGMRIGEARRLQWTDLDFERNLVTLNAPEKGSNSRMWRLSPKLIEVLKAQPRRDGKIFSGSPRAMEGTFKRTRRRLAQELQNPRFEQIHFHTFRHWKATMLYHQTKDPYYVKNFLGHRSLKSTEVYINIEHTLFEAGPNDQFSVKIAMKPEEIKTLLEAGFEYVCQKGDLTFLRKRR